MEKLLLCPGPSPIAPFALTRMSKGIIHHRSDEFKSIHCDIQKGLKPLFGTSENVVIFTASGTGGMEAAVTNTLSPLDTALIINTGKFGTRWEDICTHYHIPFDSIHVPWGDAVNCDTISNYVNKKHYAAILVQACESSTGVANPISDIGKITRHTDTLLIVDAISHIGAAPFSQDDFGVDIAICASQKALMLPPGLALIGLSKKAISQMKQKKNSGFYFNILNELEWCYLNQTAYTPAVQLWMGLHAVVQYIHQTGMTTIFESVKTVTQATRMAIRDMGLDLFASSPSDTLSVITLPASVNGATLKTQLESVHRIIVASGQEELKDNVIRVSAMGWIFADDMKRFLIALSDTLNELGFKNDRDRMVSRFDESLMAKKYIHKQGMEL